MALQGPVDRALRSRRARARAEGSAGRGHDDAVVRVRRGPRGPGDAAGRGEEGSRNPLAARGGESGPGRRASARHPGRGGGRRRVHGDPLAVGARRSPQGSGPRRGFRDRPARPPAARARLRGVPDATFPTGGAGCPGRRGSNRVAGRSDASGGSVARDEREAAATLRRDDRTKAASRRARGADSAASVLRSFTSGRGRRGRGVHSRPRGRPARPRPGLDGTGSERRPPPLAVRDGVVRVSAARRGRAASGAPSPREASRERGRGGAGSVAAVPRGARLQLVRCASSRAPRDRPRSLGRAA